MGTRRSKAGWTTRLSRWLFALTIAASVISCKPNSPNVNPPTTGTGAAVSATTTSKALPFTFGRDTTFIDNPRLADGSPDYLGALNEKLSQGVSPENNGFVLWLEVVGDDVLVDRMTVPVDTEMRDKVLALCKARRTQPGAEVLQHYSDFLKPRDPTKRSMELGLFDPTEARFTLWTAAEHPKLAEFLAKQEKLFDRAVEAAERPRWWRPMVRDGTMITPPRDGRMVREVGEDLCARATLRAKAGNVAGFQRDVLAVKKLAHHVAKDGDMVDMVVGCGTNERADEAIATVASAGVLTEAQCAGFRKQLAELPELPSLTVSVDGVERFSHLDGMVRFAMGRGEGTPDMALFGGIEADAVDWNTALRRVNHVYDEVREALREPDLTVMQTRVRDLKKSASRGTEWASEGLNLDPEPMKFSPEERRKITEKSFAELRLRLHKKPGESRDAYTSRVTPLMIGISSLEGPEEFRRRSVMRSEMVAALLAAAEVKARTGAWPAKLEELPPDMLGRVPVDIYSPKADRVRYVVSDGTPRVYSVGRNGKDDGGKRREEGGDDVVVGGSIK